MEPTWQQVVLGVANVAQVVLLAWIASRGTRRRRNDLRARQKREQE